MPSPLAALMGFASGAMGLLQKVFSQSGASPGFEAQLADALEGSPRGGMPLFEKVVADQGHLDEETLTALFGNPQALPLLQYLSAMRSLGLTGSDARALLLGDTQGISDEGLKAILASCGITEADIALIMSDPAGCADLRAHLSQAVSEKVRQHLAGTGLNMDQIIEKATADQATYNAVLAHVVVSRGFRGGSVQMEESIPQTYATTPAEVSKITAEIKESVTALLKITAPVQAAAVSLSGGGAEAAVRAAEAMDELEQTFNIPKKVVRDLLFATDTLTRQAAVEEATARISAFLDTNAGKDLPGQTLDALAMLKGFLSRQEFTRMDKALQSFSKDLSAVIQPFVLDRVALEAVAQRLEEPSGVMSRYHREVVDQIRQAIPAAVRSGEGSLSLRLNPPMLGRVDIDIRMEDGKILASFKVDQPVTRDILQLNMHVLKEALGEQGIRATQFVVTTDTFNARDHREAMAWFGPGSGRGGSQGHGGGQGSERPSRDQEEYTGGYGSVRRYAEGRRLDIIA